MRRTLLLPSLLVFTILLFESFGDPGAKYPGGSPGGYSGSPADGKNCKQCHGGQALVVNNWITSNVPASGYVPGNSYSITVTASGSGRKGFEVSPQSVNGNVLGTLIPGPAQHIVNSGKAVTHSSSINTSTASWTFNWTAPAAGTGNVTFYGAIIVGISNTKLCTLQIPESSTGIASSEASGFSIFPNPTTGNMLVQGFIPNPTTLHFILYSMFGERVAILPSENTPGGNWSTTLRLPESLPKGVYMIQIQGEGLSVSRKMILQ